MTTLQLTHLAANRDQHTHPPDDPDLRCAALQTVAAHATDAHELRELAELLGLDPITDRCTLGRMEVDE